MCPPNLILSVQALIVNPKASSKVSVPLLWAASPRSPSWSYWSLNFSSCVGTHKPFWGGTWRFMGSYK